MAKFKDTEGREWLISINVSTIKAVKEKAGVELLDVGSESGGLAKLYTDPIMLAGVVYTLCEEQAKNRNLTPEQFGQGLAGDVITNAYEAITEELVNFFPSPRHRKRIRAVMDKMKDAESKLDDLVDAKMDSPAMDQAIAAEIQKAEETMDRQLAKCGNSSSNVPESSESTQVPSASGS